MKRILIICTLVFLSQLTHAIHIHIEMTPEMLKHGSKTIHRTFGYDVNAKAKQKNGKTTITLEFSELKKKMSNDDELTVLSSGSFGQLELQKGKEEIANVRMFGEFKECKRIFEFTVSNDCLDESKFVMRIYGQSVSSKIRDLKEEAKALKGKGSDFKMGSTAMSGLNCEIPLKLVLQQELWKSKDKVVEIK